MLTALIAYETMVNVENAVIECGTELHDEKPQWGRHRLGMQHVLWRREAYTKFFHRLIPVDLGVDGRKLLS